MPSKNGRTKLNGRTSTKKEGVNQLEGTQSHLHDRAERGEKPEVSLVDMGLVGGISSSLGGGDMEASIPRTLDHSPNI